MDANAVISYVRLHWKQLLLAAFLGHMYGAGSGAKATAILHLLGF